MSLPTSLLLSFFSLVVALWSIDYSLQDSISRLGAGRLFSLVIVPWTTTLPQTITAVVLAARGLHVASLFNCVFSAIFGLFLVLPPLLHGRNVIKVAHYYPSLALLLIPLSLCLADLRISGAHEGIILLASCILLTTLPVIRLRPLGLAVELKRVERYEYPAIVVTTTSSLFALGFTSFEYARHVELLSTYVGEEVSGIMSAYLVSVPDVIYSLVAIARGSIDDAVSQMWGCVVHDFTESPGIAALIGVTISVSVKEIALVLSAVVLALLLPASRGYQVDRFVLSMMLMLFVIYTLLGIYMT